MRFHIKCIIRNAFVHSSSYCLALMMRDAQDRCEWPMSKGGLLSAEIMMMTAFVHLRIQWRPP